MKKGVWLALLTAGSHLCGSVFGQVGDERIVAAREALRKGDRNTLEQLAAIADAHPLDIYVRYWLLVNKLARPERPPAQELTSFLVGEAGSQLAERLRADWLRRLATDSDWQAFLQLYPGLQSPDREMVCLAWTARLMTGDTTVLDEIAAGWPELTDSHSACETAMRATVASGRVSEDDVWWRARRQIDTRKPAAAADTLAWLPPGSAPDATAFAQAIRSPAQYLDRLAPNFAVSREGRELALAALVRVAREDPRAAYVRLLRIQDRLGAEERGYAHAALGRHAAIDHLPEAGALFAAIDDVPLTEDQRAWRVRAALRALDWTGVRRAIEAMPEAERDEAGWTYWLGRALAATGQRAEAEALFARIGDAADFYGMLAAEELGRPFAPPAAAAMVTSATLQDTERDPGLQRALALFRLDMRTEAVREWNWALRGRDEAFSVAAAHLALRHEIYDRAINTAERANPASNFELRFLTPYRDLIEPHARSKNLDVGWVYGLMRQESRFVVPARSSAGAQGLMQVMPATGKWVAGKIGLRDYHPRRLSDPDTNVLLGTSYMRLILEGLDEHPVLASAGYNAGPGRARRWRDDKPLEGAIYAELIPFDETRDYVKKVMTNTVIYAALLERQPQSLKARLGTVGPRPAE